MKVNPNPYMRWAGIALMIEGVVLIALGVVQIVAR